MDRKACCDAEIIECINRIIEKDNDKLYDKLKKMGIAFAAMTVRQISLLEKRIATAMKKWHKSEKTSLLNSESLFSFLSSHTTESEADAELVQAVSQAVEETCGDVLQASADQYIRQTDAELSVTEISAPTAAAVSEASVQAGTSVLRHVTDEISNIIQEAINNGDSVDDAAKRIFDDRLRDEYYEARRVAQTEMMRTHAYAKYEALQQSPVVNAKRWRHTGAKGAASRENHVNISGQTVPKDQPFTLTGRDGATYHPMLPHDTALPAAEAINCHCILEAVIDKDLKSLPPEQKAQMQRDNIRALNQEYAEKSGKSGRAVGLKVDNNGNDDIININDSSSGKHWVEEIGQIDFADNDAITRALSDFENTYADSTIEHCRVITVEGKIYDVHGDKWSVNTDLLGDEMRGSINEHNHVTGESQYSFSWEDLSSSAMDGSTISKAFDEKYRYEMVLPAKSIEDDVVYSAYQQAKEEVEDINLSAYLNGQATISDEDEQHEIIKRACKKVGIKYERTIR